MEIVVPSGTFTAVSWTDTDCAEPPLLSDARDTNVASPVLSLQIPFCESPSLFPRMSFRTQDRFRLDRHRSDCRIAVVEFYNSRSAGRQAWLTPLAPAAPCGPVGPVGPCDPTAPAGPCGPGIPWGPCGPTNSARLCTTEPSANMSPLPAPSILTFPATSSFAWGANVPMPMFRGSRT